MIYTAESTSSSGLVGIDRKTVSNSVGEWVTGMAHTNGLEGFASRFKHASHGTYHPLSKKYLNLYIDEFADTYNIRELEMFTYQSNLLPQEKEEAGSFPGILPGNLVDLYSPPLN